jgi:SagB-type dehydrogenase family enzyme
MKDLKKGLGDRYQEETKHLRGGMKVYSTDVFERAEPYKQYPDATKVLPLPPAQPEKKADFWAALSSRRSQRDFTSASLSLDVLALLIFATQGITGKRGDIMFRAAPSAGALHPIETYIHANRVAGLDCGIYHLNSVRQALELIRPGDWGRQLAGAALGQDMISDGAALFIWTAIAGRSKWKYHERAYRYIYLDAGHIGQNLYLAATALGLGCCAIGAFFDTEINEIIGVDGQNETAVYLGVVGAVQT